MHEPANSVQALGIARTPTQLVLRRFLRHRAALASLAALALVIVACFGVSAVVHEEDSLQHDFDRAVQPPSMAHPLGTDEYGRDYLVRCLFGGRVSLLVGLLATLIAITVGTLLGAVAGLKGGWADNLIMRAVDVMLAMPIFFVLLLLASFREQGSDLTLVVAIIGLTSWTDVCRLVRAELLSLREKEFVESARALGAGSLRLLLVHLLPNAVSPIVVAATLGMARAIIVESALSYLGFGVQPPDVSWGSMLRNAQAQMSLYPWLAVFPGLFIFFTVLACNFLGDGLRDALDPRTRIR